MDREMLIPHPVAPPHASAAQTAKVHAKPLGKTRAPHCMAPIFSLTNAPCPPQIPERGKGSPRAGRNSLAVRPASACDVVERIIFVAQDPVGCRAQGRVRPMPAQQPIVHGADDLLGPSPRSVRSRPSHFASDKNANPGDRCRCAELATAWPSSRACSLAQADQLGWRCRLLLERKVSAFQAIRPAGPPPSPSWNCSSDRTNGSTVSRPASSVRASPVRADGPDCGGSERASGRPAASEYRGPRPWSVHLGGPTVTPWQRTPAPPRPGSNRR